MPCLTTDIPFRRPICYAQGGDTTGQGSEAVSKLTKDDIARILHEMGTYLELRGDSMFRVNAYRHAAQIVQQLNDDLEELIDRGQLVNVPGIGSTLHEFITTLVRTGSHPTYDQLRQQFPASLFEMLRIPGLGAKKVKALFDAGIATLEQLKLACEQGSVAQMRGFGAKTQEKILQGLAYIHEVGNRVRLDQAYPLGLAMLQKLRELPGVIRAELCGSLRRRRETAKDIDILISSDHPAPIMAAFVKLPPVIQVTSQGETKSSVIAAYQVGAQRIVLNADLRIVSDVQFPFALLHFTGSKDHNILLRRRANARGLELSEYGLVGPGVSIPAATEADIYAALGLDYIPPELREGTDELDAAERHALPQLVELSHIRGVFHNHTTASDGTATLEEMAHAAAQLGLEYLGIADHSQSLTVANGLTPQRVREQQAQIDALNARGLGVHLFKGIECDILPDGRLDYDDELLASFDYVVASVHSHFQQTAEEMTARIIRALKHPAVTMLGHATGRLLLRREGYRVDLDAVIRTAAEYGKMIEINAQPDRLDLDWVHVKKAKALGVMLVINPDAHSTDGLTLTRYGVDVARRGWLEPRHVFNTYPLAEVIAELNRRKARLHPAATPA
jgi:DNA polymerase (family 10)